MPTKQYVDPVTGEYFTEDEIALRAYENMNHAKQRFDWVKLYKKMLGPFAEAIGSSKLDAALWLFNNLNQADFTFVGTAQDIAEGAGVSKLTAIRTLESLYKHDIIRKIKRSYIMVNPRFIANGSTAKEVVLARRYYELPTSETNAENEAN